MPPKLNFSRLFMTCCIKLLWILLILVFTVIHSSGQSSEESKYISGVNSARSDSERIEALSMLADYYFIFAEDKKGDSLIELQIMYAEESRNPNLMFMALFHNPRFQHVEIIGKQEAGKSFHLIEKALNYSKLKGLEEYNALAYSKLAIFYSTQGKQDLANRNGATAYTTSLHTTNDSIKALCGLAYGSVLLQQGEILKAFKTYTNAYDYANDPSDVKLISKVYHAMAGLFKKLKERETEKDYLLKSLTLNSENNNTEGILEDYLALGKYNDYQTGITYLQRAVKLADSTRNLRYKLQAEKLIFFQKMVNAPYQETLDYLASRPHIKKSIENKGPGYFDWTIGQVYLYSRNADTALKYMRAAQRNMDKYDAGTKLPFYYEYALSCNDANQNAEAIENLKKAMDYALATSDLYFQTNIAGALKKAYEKERNFELAIEYDNLYDSYKDSAARLAPRTDIVLVQIDTDNKMRLKAEEEALAKERRRHDIQYIGITIAIGIAFLLLLAFGMFTVSKTTIRIMAFFSFILLFEFIILILDNYIHHMTHGEPLKVWGIKIVLISMLIPFHHFLEEKLTHYLVSRKLIVLRSQFSLKRLIFGEKKPVTREPQAEEISSVKDVIAD